MSERKTRISGEGDMCGAGGSFVRHFVAGLHKAFTTLVENCEGLEDRATRSRYALLLLYRLMFLYFLQQRGLLAGDRRYLQDHLQQASSGDIYSFYRDILRPLFSTTPANFPVPITRLFIPHEIERNYPALALPNTTFTGIFAFFEQYCWQSGEESKPGSRVITPSMLSLLFEQAISQRETATYYTPTDVTTYIARHTIYPALFTRTQERYPATEMLLWEQLKSQPARYIFAAVHQGCELALPAHIADGLKESTQRQTWQQAAPEPYALPGETWREVIARRLHVEEIRKQLSAENANDKLKRLVTWNLDQGQLTLDLLKQAPSPAFLNAFYQSLSTFTIIDPTCGSGAFLFAALAQLEPLYTACLDSMEELLASASANTSMNSDLEVLRACLAQMGEPGERKQAIPNWIIQHNLYGVDLLQEAVEICRLRLFLKLITALPEQQAVNLPADFGKNIYVGNSLSGSIQTEHLSTEKKGGKVGDSLFHSAFQAIMQRGGFDVVLGNPPYMEFERVRPHYALDAGYTTLETGNLYALSIERGTQLLLPGGRFGMIVPASATCTDGYHSLQKLLLAQQELHIASFSDQRGRLFTIPHPRLCIILYEKAAQNPNRSCQVFSTPYLKIGSRSRNHLFERLNYTEVTDQTRPGLIPRYGSALERALHSKLTSQAHSLSHYLHPAGDFHLYYTRKLSWFVQVTPFIPLILDSQGQTRAPSELKYLRFAQAVHAQLAFAALNSHLFYWLITTSSDCRNLNLREILHLPLDLASIQLIHQRVLCQLAQELERDLQANSIMRQMHFKGPGRLTIQCMYPAHSQQLIEQIDHVLGEHYAFTIEELDFLLHYDHQYRRQRRKTRQAKIV